jgi:hypothetical protein
LRVILQVDLQTKNVGQLWNFAGLTNKWQALANDPAAGVHP